MTLYEETLCEDCNGKGEHFTGVTGCGMGKRENYKPCSHCNGTGSISVLSEARIEELVRETVQCILSDLSTKETPLR